jgi:hypothetical protein
LVFPNDLFHLSLLETQIIDYETEASVRGVVLLQSSVHLVGLLLELADLLFFRLNLPLQFFDLVIKHELELLQLLGLLLQSVNLIFLFADRIVLLDDLQCFFSDVTFELLDHVLLLSQLRLLVLDLPL